MISKEARALVKKKETEKKELIFMWNNEVCPKCAGESIVFMSDYKKGEGRMQCMSCGKSGTISIMDSLFE